jgi:hypothetical protein
MNIHWLEVISNEELWWTGKIEMSTQIKRRKWYWIGHTLRKGHEAIERGLGLEPAREKEESET